MTGRFRKFAVLGAVLVLSLTAGMVAWGSSHREAPLISHDPTADNTDVYAFVSPDKPNTVTLIATYIPFEGPSGGPNFYGFGDDVLYEIHVDNDADARADISYQFRFNTTRQNPDTFLYNTGPITSLTDPDWNVRQTYTVTRIEDGRKTVLGKNLRVPPVNVGENSIANYEPLAAAAIRSLPGGIKVFAGQRDDPFFVDLRVFDLLQPKPPAVDSLAGFNTHAIAIQVPKAALAAGGREPAGAGAAEAIIGVWATAARQRTTVLSNDARRSSGSFVQVSRLGAPLVNEVVVPLGKKDRWNGSQPEDDTQFLSYVTDPELARLFAAIFGLDVPPPPRDDLVQVFLTGVPGLNQPAGVTPSEQLRLNMGIKPTTKPNRLGVLGGDLAGFPNGRRLVDDVLDIAERAVAGVLVEGFDKAPNNALGDGVDKNDAAFKSSFPYLASPWPGND